MKKFFLFAAVLAIFSCSNNDEIIDSEQPVGKLVDAEIGIDMGKSQTTRAYLGTVTQDKNQDGTYKDTYTISHLFEAYDQMYITDYLGQHSFTVQQDGQTTTIKGKWAEIDDDAVKNGILATFPSSAVTKKVTVSDGKPTMYFKLSTNQTSYVNEEQLSYDKNAGLAFACADNKNDNLWFLPVVSYLYFYSEKPNCTITSTAQGIAGNYTVTYSGNAGTGTNNDGTTYNTAEGLSQLLTYTADAKEITCHGQHVEGHRNKFDKDAVNYYEYIIAIKPGNYDAKSLKITPEGATKSLNCPEMELIPSELYFIGSIDASTK